MKGLGHGLNTEVDEAIFKGMRCPESSSTSCPGLCPTSSSTSCPELEGVSDDGSEGSDGGWPDGEFEVDGQGSWLSDEEADVHFEVGGRDELEAELAGLVSMRAVQTAEKELEDEKRQQIRANVRAARFWQIAGKMELLLQVLGARGGGGDEDAPPPAAPAVSPPRQVSSGDEGGEATPKATPKVEAKAKKGDEGGKATPQSYPQS